MNFASNHKSLVFLFGLAGLAALAAAAGHQGGLVFSALALAGALAGASLLQASFGFTASWRALIVEGRTQGFRIQILMFAVVGIVVLSLMAWGGGAYRGALAPIGLAGVLGAFLFGIGMHLAGNCASGAMFGTGSGNLKALVTVVGFVLGVTVAVATFDTWSVWPALPTVSLVHQFGGGGAVFSHLLLCSIVLAVAVFYERFRRGRVDGLLADHTADHRLLGRWPLLWGAIGLGVAAILIVLLSGRPWGLISAYALWGSKLVALTGEDVSFWGHWAANPAILDKSIFADSASVIDLGVLVGALMAAALSGRFVLRLGAPPSGLFLALTGGIVMGFGARLSVGCNIGAFFSGTISGSLHGWLWGLFALMGMATAIGVARLMRRGSDATSGAEAVASSAASPA